MKTIPIHTYNLKQQASSIGKFAKQTEGQSGALLL